MVTKDKMREFIGEIFPMFANNKVIKKKIDYSKYIKTEEDSKIIELYYICTSCHAKRVKLWRKNDNQLFCIKCLKKKIQNKVKNLNSSWHYKDIKSLNMEDCKIGNYYFPAIPRIDNHMCYQPSEVPYNAFRFWKIMKHYPEMAA